MLIPLKLLKLELIVTDFGQLLAELAGLALAGVAERFLIKSVRLTITLQVASGLRKAFPAYPF